jgi:hypothetical protein
MTVKLYTPKEDALLRKLIAKGLSKLEISKHFKDRSYGSITKRAYNLGLTPPKKPKDIDKRVGRHNKKMPIDAILFEKTRGHSQPNLSIYTKLERALKERYRND